MKMMQDEAFLSRDNRERIAVVTALGETKTDEALEYFSGIFEQKAGLFSRGKIND